jgi:hypothetical protein
MNEAQWEKCTSPAKIITFLQHRGSDRRWRLFGCACCRRIWPLLTDERSRRAVEVSERFVDGLAGREELLSSADAGRMAVLALRGTDFLASLGDPASVEAAVAAIRTGGGRSWINASQAVGNNFARRELRAQCHLLRDLFGSVFRSQRFNPAWLVSNDALVRRLAETIYAERAFDRLPILADALEDAGCDNADLLAHCRSGGEHVRGCWAVDLILGKE